MNDHTNGGSLLIVKRNRVVAKGESALVVEQESTEPGDAHAIAEHTACQELGQPVSIEVYRRIAVYEAEVKVTMRKDGE